VTNKPHVLGIGIKDVQFGEGVTIMEPCNIYGCTGAGSFVGPFVEIQKGGTIGERTKVQSHTFVRDLMTMWLSVLAFIAKKTTCQLTK